MELENFEAPQDFSRVVLACEPMSFAGQIALVTGASRGIGRAIGLAFARVGAYVIVNYRGNEAAAEAVLAAIEAAGGRGELCQFDVAEESQIETAVKENR